MAAEILLLGLHAGSSVILQSPYERSKQIIMHKDETIVEGFFKMSPHIEGLNVVYGFV
jgi:hypothetical protein